MKLKIIVYFLILIFFQLSPAQANFKYKLGQTVSDTFYVHSRTTIPLPEGEWKVVYREAENLFRGIYIYYVLLAQVENNIPIKLFGISKVNGITTSYGFLSPWIVENVFKRKKHGCVNRQYYSYFEFYRGGAAHNCFIIQHLDMDDELYNIEPWQNMGFVLNWAKKNNIKFPKIYLAADGYMYLPRVADRWMAWGYVETPKSFANYNVKFKTRDTSEFHPNNIDRYEEAKKVMEDFLNFGANYHQEIQNSLKVKGKNKLDLSAYITNVSVKSKSNKSNENLIEDLEKLNDLYKSGVLTKEQFKKAKDKLLN